MRLGNASSSSATAWPQASASRLPPIATRDSPPARRNAREHEAGLRLPQPRVRNLKIAEIHETQLPKALSLEPDLAIVIAGGNDALSRRFNPETVRAGLLSLTEPLADRGTYIVSIGLFDLPRTGLLPPELAGPMAERFDLFDRIAAEVTGSLGGLHVDTHHHPRSSDPAIYSSDRIHGNARGHAIAYAAIVDALASVSARRP